VAINGARNAAILATQILGAGMPEYQARIVEFKRGLADG
jgi:5-(carboxyamino)imidazole ribonucleotide mutase